MDFFLLHLIYQFPAAKWLCSCGTLVEKEPNSLCRLFRLPAVYTGYLEIIVKYFTLGQVEETKLSRKVLYYFVNFPNS